MTILPTTVTLREIVSQPDVWPLATAAGREWQTGAQLLTQPVQFVGCGTSYYVGIAAAALVEQRLGRPARAVPASEFRPLPGWSAIFITRSGTTTEVLQAMALAREAGTPLAVLTNDPDSPAGQAPEALCLPEASDQSVVQTRSATSNLLVLRAAIAALAGVDDPQPGLPAEAMAAIEQATYSTAADYSHFVYLGAGWAAGVAAECALKMREAALTHSESYHTAEYRHGPIALAGPHSLVRILDPITPASRQLAAEISAHGATVLLEGSDPLAQLVAVQVEALVVAAGKALDPDAPRHLSRSVVLKP